MQLGMVGLGRMGANMVRRLMRAGHECVAYDVSADAVKAMESEGATGATSPEEMASKLDAPRHVWIMVPAGYVDDTIAQLVPHLAQGDVVIDGGNSHYHHDIRRARELAEKGLHYVDVGTSGGVFGLERGYCLMIGGEKSVVERLDPVFDALSPPRDSAKITPGREGRKESSAEHGYLHCGPAGAGHFVKMVHNGIEYGLMAAYAEGFNILRQAGLGLADQEHDAETTPLSNPEHFQYRFDLADVAELWRRGSVIPSWLLDLTAAALAKDADLAQFSGRVSDSGEGRWTIQAAIEEGVPAPVLTSALFSRFSSRGLSEFSDKVLSAMRYGFGGHLEKKD